MTRRAVVTGIGTVGPWGAGTGELGRILREGAAPLSELDSPRSLGLPLDPRVRWSGRVDPAWLEPWLSPRERRRMSAPSRFAVAAARMALEHGGHEIPDGGADDLGVILSTTFGPVAVTEEMLGQIFTSGPEAASPFLFAESVANAPAAQVARLLGARGANLTVTEREAGALMAVRRAAGEIVAGRSARMFAGVSDEVTPVLQAILDRLGSLARGDGDGPPVARPFDRRRSGFVTAEGSTVLLLEEADDLAARGGRPLARVVGGGEAFDPSAPRCGWGSGHEILGRSLAGVLERAGLTFDDLDLVVSGATGSRDGDRLEALTLREALERMPQPTVRPAAGSAARSTADRRLGLPAVVAPKSAVGELGGGHLAAAVLLLGAKDAGTTREAPSKLGEPPGGFGAVDPELGITPYSGPLPVAPVDSGRPGRVLIQTIAAGGPAAWLVLEGPDPHPSRGASKGGA